MKNMKTEGIKMKYFVLKPKGNNRYAEASRKAMRAYAAHIDSVNQDLARELRNWADSEHMETLKSEEEPEDGLKACVKKPYESTEPE